MLDLLSILWYIGLMKMTFLIIEFLYFRLIGKISIEKYQYGWVVITGASDGIGKEIAVVLAKRGFKIILISRNKIKLEQLAKSLQFSSNNPNVHCIPSDFSFSHNSPEEFYANLLKKLENYEISALINNVGTCEYRFFSEQKLESIENMLAVNLYPVTMLTYHMLPKFIKRFENTKQRSLIVNFSSTVDLISVPTTVVYSATKTFIDYLSEGIRKECTTGIDIATIKPGVVATNMSSSHSGNGLDALPLTVDTNQYAEYLLTHLHTGINYGHWKHYILVFILTLLPRQLTTYLLTKMLPIFEKIGLVKHT